MSIINLQFIQCQLKKIDSPIVEDNALGARYTCI